LIYPFCLVSYPRTKSILLESMDGLLSKELVPRRAHKVVMQELAEDEESFRMTVEGSDLGFEKDELRKRRLMLKLCKYM
jgi:hypothetical protein